MECNKAIFENGSPSITSVVYKILGIFNRLSVAPTLHTNRIFQTPILEGTTMGWFDGFASTNGLQSGAGRLLNINDNTFYKWKFNSGPGTNTRE
jgi:hypothetical protein